MKRSTPTIKDIAKAADVSYSTVSRVINNKGRISEEVRERVLTVIEEMGYRPNLAARSLVNQRTYMIGVAIHMVYQRFFSDPYFSLLLQMIDDAAYDLGYTTLIASIRESADNLYERTMATRLLEGVIVLSTHNTDPLLEKLLLDDMPFVAYGQRPDHDSVSTVGIDNYSGAVTATQHLVNQGYQRIGIITGPKTHESYTDRLEGYKNALETANLPVDPSLIVLGNFKEDGGYSSVQEILLHKPDALFITNGSMAVGALRALNELNISVPDDVAIVTFDDHLFENAPDPFFTTMRQPMREIGRKLVTSLIQLIESPERQPLRIILPTELIIRESCGAKRSP